MMFDAFGEYINEDNSVKLEDSDEMGIIKANNNQLKNDLILIREERDKFSSKASGLTHMNDYLAAARDSLFAHNQELLEHAKSLQARIDQLDANSKEDYEFILSLEKRIDYLEDKLENAETNKRQWVDAYENDVRKEHYIKRLEDKNAELESLLTEARIKLVELERASKPILMKTTFTSIFENGGIGFERLSDVYDLNSSSPCISVIVREYYRNKDGKEYIVARVESFNER